MKPNSSFRHCMRQLASRFSVLAAVEARTRRIEVDTGVIPGASRTRSRAEDAGTSDLIHGEHHLQVGFDVTR